MRSDNTRRTAVTLLAAACTVNLLAAQQTAAPKFRPHDPVVVADDRGTDAGGTTRDPLGHYADFVLNTFFSPGERQDGAPALNVNTIGEVPDSSWFTNRLGVKAMSLEEVVRGPDRVSRLDVREWIVVEGKETGRQPGFRAIDASDPSRQIYQIEFDPRSNPEMATGAEVIGTAFYHALGYNVVDVYLIDLDRASVRIAPDATVRVNGKRRAFTARDLEALLRGVARKPDGRYRALASRFAEGRNLGPFRYSGTRSDDPNDIVPHEHRRELRGNRVFCAWLNHDDSRAVNTLDMLVGPPGRQVVRHYMFDFGSILGSGTDANDLPWVGHEYVMEARPALRTLLSFGLYRRPFIKVRTPRGLPAAGNFTADGFRPDAWKPHYRNPAFLNMQAEDAFWAARRLAALSPAVIKAVVEKAGYGDPRVTDYVAGTLIRRRELALGTWLTAMNPVVDARIEADHQLRFANAAVSAGQATPPNQYELSWFRYDNVRNLRSLVGATEVTATPRGVLPENGLAGSEYAGVDIRTRHPAFPGWYEPVRFYFHRTDTGWLTVGVERRPADAAGYVLGSR